MLVSCIMPVANRRNLVPLAIDAYLAQDWTEKQLVVIDDGEEKLEDLFDDVPFVVYIRHKERARIGVKRNEACYLASGELICHWDSDDWSASSRISEQVQRLTETDADVVGYNSMLFWNDAVRQASLYTSNSNYAVGSSLMYRREYWEQNNFPAANIGEDNLFIQKAQLEKKLHSIPGEGLMVARIHDDNVSKRIPLAWPIVESERIPKAFFSALELSKAASV